MGYESKLYVVDKCSIPASDDKHLYAQVVAMFDLCKAGIHRSNFRDTDCAFYADDGNTLVLEDCYGDSIGELTIPEVIKLIEDQQKECPEYRRWEPCLALLKSFKEDEWKNLVVLHYGY